MPPPEYRDRCHQIIFTSAEEKNTFVEAALSIGQPLSKYILEMARRGRDESRSRTGSPDAAKELTDLREENRRLRAEQTELRKLYDRAEADIFKLRHGSYSDENFQGDRQPRHSAWWKSRPEGGGGSVDDRSQ